jgi:large subunit ribosomal protein L30
MAKSFVVTQMRSLIGCSDTQRRTMAALGLRGRHKSVKLSDNPANRGQITKVQHLVEVKVER